MLDQISNLLQSGAIVLLLVTSLLLALNRKEGKHVWLGISFCLTVVCVLVLRIPEIRQSKLIWLLTMTAAFTNPVLFWFLARAIFDDHFKPSMMIVAWILLICAAHASFYVRNIYLSEPIFDDPGNIGRIVSAGFVLAGLFTAIKTRRDDLVDSRLHFRKIFVVVTAVVTIFAIGVKVFPIPENEVTIIRISQSACIILLTSFLLAKNFRIRPGLFFQENAKPKPVSSDPNLKAALLSQLNEHKVYRKEGLTIRILADLMDVQEYRLRLLINGELGFRNFNDFLNQYRIAEACLILTDPTQQQKTVQEISYQLGYKSIGPFNKAFKETKGVTPTAFRKGHPS